MGVNPWKWGSKVPRGTPVPPHRYLDEASRIAIEAYRARRDAAGLKVNAAIRRGTLPPVKGQACVDCGDAATLYEHRNYYKPLDVEPTCRPCNRKRGRANDFPDEIFYMTQLEAAYRGLDGWKVPDHLIDRADAYFKALGLSHIKNIDLPLHFRPQV